VQQRSWTFRRGDEQLVLQRHKQESGLALVVIRNGNIQHIPFHEEAALDVFQNDMEELLVHTGWTLQECVPERRKRDRRRFPRVTNDRRRWWTDPVGDESAVPAGGERRTSRRKTAKK